MVITWLQSSPKARIKNELWPILNLEEIRKYSKYTSCESPKGVGYYSYFQ